MVLQERSRLICQVHCRFQRFIQPPPVRGPKPLLCVVGGPLRKGHKRRFLTERRNGRLRLSVVAPSIGVTIRKDT
jgi:hypothetical protein